MKHFIDRLFNASFEWWLGLLMITTIATIITFTTIAAFKDHRPQCYYMSSEVTSTGIAYKIITNIDWAANEIAFTTGNKDEMLEVLSELKQCAKKGDSK